MKLKYFLIAALIAVVGFAFFYPVNKQVSITIHSSMFNVYTQLNNAENWIKWNKYLKNKGAVAKPLNNKKGFIISTASTTIRVERLDAFIFGVKKGNTNYDIALIPQKYDKTTTVVLRFSSNLLYSLLTGNSTNRVKETSVNDLKGYLESPLASYDVDFKRATVKDMDMMVYSIAVNPVNQFTEMEKWAKNIKSLLPAGAAANDHKIYVQVTKMGEKLNLLIGARINRQLPAIGKLTYRPAPGGKVLTVNYNGKYNERKKVYAGIGMYLQDHGMENTIQPIEVYPDNGLPANDTARVNMQIVFHVF